MKRGEVMEKNYLLHVLWKADIFWNVEQIREIIKNATKEMLEYRDGGIGHTALTLTCLRGRMDIAKMLIEAGSNVDAKTNDGDTSLSFALEYEYYDIFKLLLENGANPNQEIDHTSILIKSLYSDDKYALLLLKYGADVDYKDIDGYTPLLSAISKEKKKVAKDLIKRGANLNTVNQDGDTPLTFAVTNGDLELIKYMIKESKKRKKGAKLQINKRLKEDAALIISFYSGFYFIFDFLMENGADINISTKNGKTVVDYIRRKVELEFLSKYEDKFKGEILKKYKSKRLELIF
jgi:ankyrin repeat protein